MTDTAAPNAMRAHLLTLTATAIVSTSFPVGAAITHDIDSLVLTLLRFVIAAILFAPLVVWRTGWRLPSLADLARYATMSALLVGFFWGMFEALRETSPLNTAAIFTLTPAIAALVSLFLLKERPNATARTALAVGFAGALWVIVRGDLDTLMALDFNRGDAIFLAATVCMGFYGPSVKALHRGEPMVVMTFWTLFTGSVWLALLAAYRLPDIQWLALPLRVYGGVAYLAVFSTLFTFFFFQWSTQAIGPTKVMSYTYLQPVLVFLIGLALGEAQPAWTIYPGLVFAVGATIILQRSSFGARRL